MSGAPNYIAEPAIAVVVVALCLIAIRFGRQKQPVADILEQIDRDEIEAALASERGEIIRAEPERLSFPLKKQEYASGRVYHVTLRVGSVLVRRRVEVRAGAPAVLLP
jgi:hypothetical protein